MAQEFLPTDWPISLCMIYSYTSELKFLKNLIIGTLRELEGPIRYTTKILKKTVENVLECYYHPIDFSNNMTKPLKAVVLGSGIAGIAASIRLANKGYAVTVFEKNNYTGGKIHALNQEKYRFDLGPSLFTMPHLVEELFTLSNREAKSYFEYKKKEVICNYFWEDGLKFKAYSDPEKFISKASQTFNTDACSIRNYIKRNKKKYELTSTIFLEKSLHKYKSYLNKSTLKALLGLNQLDLNKTLHEVNTVFFKDPHLVQLFNRFATYNGSSPYKTPGLLSLIPHLEMNLGTYIPKGGMHQISQSLTKLAKDIGVHFEMNAAVEEIIIKNKKASGVKVNNNVIKADVVVSNIDVHSLYNSVLQDTKEIKKLERQEPSSSAVVFYWGINTCFEELDLHNILFSDNYEEEFQHIFEEKIMYDDPTVYINISSKDCPDDAPKGGENWFVMVNAPSNNEQDWSAEITKVKKAVIKKINRILKTDIEKHIVCESSLTPAEIESNTASYKGALYGSSSNDKFSAFLRHPNFKSDIDNLYFCGGSVHPGGGIPLCLLSAKIATDLITS